MSNIFDSMLPVDDENQTRTDEPGSDLTAEADSAGQPNSVSEMEIASNSATPFDVKEATQELLKFGFIEESRKSSLFQKAMIHRKAVLTALEPLDLTFQIDSYRGIAFLKVGKSTLSDSGEKGQEWSHPLVRRHRLTLEQSLVIAILRQMFMAVEQEVGVGEGAIKIAVDDLLPQFLTYFEDSGSDAKNESRLLNILDQLKTHGIVSEVDKNQELIIRPLIAHVADPASLNSLLNSLQKRSDMEGVARALEPGESSNG